MVAVVLGAVEGEVLRVEESVVARHDQEGAVLLDHDLISRFQEVLLGLRREE
jgi:isocitrate lyase